MVYECFTVAGLVVSSPGTRRFLERRTAGDDPREHGLGAIRGRRGSILDSIQQGGISREAADRSVANLEIHELPAARGCTYVLPAADFALALKLAQPFRESEIKLARKLGVTDREMNKLSTAVRKALVKGPLDPDEIRDAVGGAARNLGEEERRRASRQPCRLHWASFRLKARSVVFRSTDGWTNSAIDIRCGRRIRCRA